MDGDRLVALFATDLANRGLLAGATVVVTVMTNLGFHQAMAAAGVNVHTVSVGDRYVLEALDANGWSLGGEQSGHIIFRSLATTGDGVLSGLLLADLLVTRQELPWATWPTAALQRLPAGAAQRGCRRPGRPGRSRGVWEEVRRLEQDLGPTGASCSARAAPSPWSGSWSKPRPKDEAEAAAERIVRALQAALGNPASL